MDLHFRTAKNDDLDRLIDVHLAAYPDHRGAEERKRNFTGNPFGSFEDLVIAEHGGDIIAHAFLFPFSAYFGGRKLKVGGIASVAVAPEARGRGVGTALMRYLHVRSDMRGDAVTMLYAFRYGYYTRLGYGVASSRKRITFDPASVPDTWCALARARVRRARGTDREAIQAAHERAASHASGWIVRPATLWDRLFARERRHVLVAAGNDDGVAGYVAFTVEQETSWGEQTLAVSEIVAEDDETRRALYGAIGGMRDQAAEAVIEVDAADPLEHGLLDLDRRRFGDDVVEHGLGTLVGGPMYRIEDVTRALEARGYAADGAFDIVVRAARGADGSDPGDEIAVSLCAEDGRTEVSAARGGGAIRTSRAGLAAMFYGGLRPSDAVRLGLAEGDARTIARADAVLAMPPVAPLDAF